MVGAATRYREVLFVLYGGWPSSKMGGYYGKMPVGGGFIWPGYGI